MYVCVYACRYVCMYVCMYECRKHSKYRMKMLFFHVQNRDYA